MQITAQNKEKTYSRGKERALYILQRGDKTEHELKLKLSQNGYSDSVIQEILAFLKEYGYIDDFRYAFRYKEYKSKSRSCRQIKGELIRKGIPSHMIKELFEEQPEEYIAIKLLIEKKRIDVSSVEQEELRKLINFLLRKGFPYEQVMQVIRECREFSREM